MDDDALPLIPAPRVEEVQGGEAPIQVVPVENCPVCLQSLTQGELHQLPCGHSLHLQCIFAWVNDAGRRTCPVCRAPTSQQAASDATNHAWNITVDEAANWIIAERYYEAGLKPEPTCRCSTCHAKQCCLCPACTISEMPVICMGALCLRRVHVAAFHQVNKAMSGIFNTLSGMHQFHDELPTLAALMRVRCADGKVMCLMCQSGDFHNTVEFLVHVFTSGGKHSDKLRLLNDELTRGQVDLDRACSLLFLPVRYVIFECGRQQLGTVVGSPVPLVQSITVGDLIFTRELLEARLPQIAGCRDISEVVLRDSADNVASLEDIAQTTVHSFRVGKRGAEVQQGEPHVDAPRAAQE